MRLRAQNERKWLFFWTAVVNAICIRFSKTLVLKQNHMIEKDIKETSTSIFLCISEIFEKQNVRRSWDTLYYSNQRKIGLMTRGLSRSHDWGLLIEQRLSRGGPRGLIVINQQNRLLNMPSSLFDLSLETLLDGHQGFVEERSVLVSYHIAILASFCTE